MIDAKLKGRIEMFTREFCMPGDRKQASQDIHDFISAERERCAKIAAEYSPDAKAREAFRANGEHDLWDGIEHACSAIAAAIRGDSKAALDAAKEMA